MCRIGLAGKAQELVGDLFAAVALCANLSDRAAVDGVPLVVQDDYYCGPAALSMVLSWSGPDVSQQEIAAQNLMIKADPTQVHQVLINLCTNAADAMPEGGELRVAAANATHELREMGAI